MHLQISPALPADSTGPPAPSAIREDAPTDALIAWIFERFAKQRIIATTQFGMEGCALVHMLAHHAPHLTLVYIDTGFFFPETYALRDKMIRSYQNVSFISGGTEMTPEAQATRHGPELWKRDPAQCCMMRKVEPLRAVMRDVDVWITGLRRSQSPTRANIGRIEWDWQYQLLKINPLAEWSRQQIWDYVRENDVPHNPLHKAGYPSIGCMQCTQRVDGATVTDYSRDGRWSGTGKTECGIHGDGI
jgi:phosphoadenosine phosphosulfate reductase